MPPPFRSGEEIFDSIMREIEPDLVSHPSPPLEEKYKDETPEQKVERGKRYEKAFQEYDVRYKAYLAEQQSKVHTFKRDTLRFFEADAGKDDAANLQSLESKLSAS